MFNALITRLCWRCWKRPVLTGHGPAVICATCFLEVMGVLLSERFMCPGCGRDADDELTEQPFVCACGYEEGAE